MKWGAHTYNPKGGDPSGVDSAPPVGRRIVLAGFRTLPVPPQSATITFPMSARLMSVGGLEKSGSCSADLLSRFARTESGRSRT